MPDELMTSTPNRVDLFYSFIFIWNLLYLSMAFVCISSYGLACVVHRCSTFSQRVYVDVKMDVFLLLLTHSKTKTSKHVSRNIVGLPLTSNYTIRWVSLSQICVRQFHSARRLLSDTFTKPTVGYKIHRHIQAGGECVLRAHHTDETRDNSRGNLSTIISPTYWDVKEKQHTMY